MPELPEVETIARYLRGESQGSRRTIKEAPGEYSLLNRKIIDSAIRWERTIAEPTPSNFKAQIRGQRIRAIGRRAKYLRLDLDTHTLLIHLRMSGDLLIRKLEHAEAPHDRLILFLDGDLSLAFNDTRKFGRVWLVSDPDTILSKLGPEPLGPDFTPVWFYQELHKRRRQIKPLLLDQAFLAGMGNIYTDEALHRSQIHPLRTSDSLTDAEAQTLWTHIRAVLEDGIRDNGASIDWVYRGGEFQNQFRVYGRSGEPCPTCRTPIEKLVVGQRGTHICPTCQPVPTLPRQQ